MTLELLILSDRVQTLAASGVYPLIENLKVRRFSSTASALPISGGKMFNNVAFWYKPCAPTVELS
jgi:hypothetical protein